MLDQCGSTFATLHIHLHLLMFIFFLSLSLCLARYRYIRLSAYWWIFFGAARKPLWPRLRGEAPIALVSGPSETSVNCGFVVSAQVGSGLEIADHPQGIQSIWPTPSKDRERKRQKTVCFSLQLAKNIAVHNMENPSVLDSRSCCGGIQS